MATTAGDENHLFIDAELEGNSRERAGDEEEKSQPLWCHDVDVVNERETRRGVMKRAWRKFDLESRGDEKQ